MNELLAAFGLGALGAGLPLTLWVWSLRRRAALWELRHNALEADLAFREIEEPAAAEPASQRIEVHRINVDARGNPFRESRWILPDPFVAARHIENERRQGASGQLIVDGQIVEEWGPLINQPEGSNA